MNKFLPGALVVSVAFNVYQWDLYRPWPGTAGSEHMTDQWTPFRYRHHWRMHHRDFDYLVDNAPSVDAARAELVRTITQEDGYRLPHWWELSRWYENITPDFRDEVEKAQAPAMMHGSNLGLSSPQHSNDAAHQTKTLRCHADVICFFLSGTQPACSRQPAVRRPCVRRSVPSPIS
jgi:hypothetical protein